MAAVAFDTLKLARTLRTEANMSAEQAEGISNALAEAMSGAELATKTDVSALKTDMSALRADMKASIAASESRLEVRIEASKTEILKAVMGMILSAVAINVLAILAGMIGIAKLLGH
ncbi:MAG: hypothetical protein WCK65_08355 [Rhodospirillaceae bacterium]